MPFRETIFKEISFLDISFLCELFGASDGFMLQEHTIASLLLCRQWMNWQRIVRQVCLRWSLIAHIILGFMDEKIINRFSFELFASLVDIP
uniref:Uncharacterized protein n=1 Tax=Heterorhabditis bacteriophora TaxID=37862 RepID=A0A1I7WUZ7_HETBA